MIESIWIAILIACINKIDVMPVLTSIFMLPIYLTTILYLLPYILKLCKYDIESKAKKYIRIYGNGILLLPFITFGYYIVIYHLYLRLAIGIILFIFGYLLNQIAAYKNNNKMPVFPSLSYSTKFFTTERANKSETHQLGNENTKVIYLTDIFDLGYNVFSLGDILLFSVYGILMYGVLMK